MPSTMEKPTKTKKGAPAPEVAALTVAVPFVATTKYAQRVVYLELRDGEAVALRGVLEGLEQRGAKMPNGKPVASSQDALRWLLLELSRSGT